MCMATRKDGSTQPLDEGRGTSLSRQGDPSTDSSRVNEEDNLDTRSISSDIEEGDEDYDDEELEDEENEEDEEDDDLDEEEA